MILAPKNGAELKLMLDWAQEQQRPLAIRYPRGSAVSAPQTSEPPVALGRPEIITEGHDITLVALGPMVEPALKASEELANEDISVGVVNARFVKPLDEGFYGDLAERTKGIITIEDGTTVGGFGSGLIELMLKIKPEKTGSIINLGFPDKFIEHGPRSALLKKYGLSAEGILKAAGTLLGTKIETNPRKS
jgi:1-deoxy-D-xylulose-5-phosphate synthase